MSPFAADSPDSNPYAAPKAASGPEADSDEFSKKLETAWLWRRIVAFLIDLVIAAVPLYCLAILIGIAGNHTLGQGLWDSPTLWPTNEPMAIILMLFADMSVPIGFLTYCTLLEASSLRGTLGKVCIGIAVTDMRGQRIGLRRSLGRNVAKVTLNLAYVIPFLFALFRRNRQTLYDRLSGTRVIRVRAIPAEPESPPV